MMFSIRRADDRGLANLGWLNSRHTFSFADYHDRRFMGFGPLRVINEDRVSPGRGFGTHGHQDMEIISYVLDGALEHKDNMGNGSVIRPGTVQRMSAGTGVQHSEYNASSTENVHFLQIWVIPEQDGLQPGYEEINFPTESKRRRLLLIGSQDGRDGSVVIHQDLNLYATVLNQGESVRHNIAEGRKGWMQVTRGAFLLNEQSLSTGDGVPVTGPTEILLSGASPDAELLLFDMTG